jgi:hypothetical protein
VSRYNYFTLAYRIYRANAHSVLSSIRLAARDALARVPF